MMRAAGAALAALVLLAGCGSAASETPRATVFAASSLAEVFREIDPEGTFNFAGSDRLAFQIEQAAPADVFASASPDHTGALHDKGLVRAPRVFATNRVVVIVPRANPAGIRTMGDLAAPGVKLVIGDDGVPIGAYTRRALAGLGLERALDNVVSREQDVKAIAAKVAIGEADAGVVYRTDVRPVADEVTAIPLPSASQPLVEYEIAVVGAARHPAEAAAFVAKVLGPRGRAALRAHGFGVPATR